MGASPRSRAGLAPLLLVPLVVLALQLLAAARLRAEERDAAVAFTVISIEPERRSTGRAGGASAGREGAEEGLEDGARAYEEENQTHERQVGPRVMEMQPWAVNKPSFSAELGRIITYITRPQLNCSRVLPPGKAQAVAPPVASARWLLCAEDWLLPAADRLCVAYSFSAEGGDADFLSAVSRLGCETHSFDPGTSSASVGHPGNSLASNHGNRGVVSQHGLWLEWRAAKRRGHGASRQPGRGFSHGVMAALGHRTVNFLYADRLSAEWRLFQNWIEAGTLQNIHHLVATVHLHWAGFEVGGSDEEVLRYWFSVLRGLEAAGLHLVHSSSGEDQGVLKRAVESAHSSYTLSWVNTRR
ncbi:LOW QUALITY PROTEIN: probable methyltransferase-like protein 24 [Poeciliopsis prolifica]|uniref:LOW QUALITY PROTEIN: probable methyltransferase-like protein 24 n=1 Tax=Poeciliopsis prolifica TaxID=188132 RepID=UPI00241387E8|nr:LOW QUALITY PROTEIN: probable methyltransferase-like protein 24 [Poeciliopsis prolifica]